MRATKLAQHITHDMDIPRCGSFVSLLVFFAKKKQKKKRKKIPQTHVVHFAFVTMQHPCHG